MRTRIISLAVVAVALAGAGGTALAGGNAQRSACGDAHAADASVNGNFGFLGEAGGTPGYHNGATGQDAGATGANNSSTGCQTQP